MSSLLLRPYLQRVATNTVCCSSVTLIPRSINYNNNNVYAKINTFSTSATTMSNSFVPNQHKPAVLANLESPIYATLAEAKGKKGLNFEQVAKAIGRSEIYTAAIFYGQTKPEKKDLEALSSTLDIPYAELEEYLGPNYVPHRGLCEMPPRDPVIYRLYEAVMVYGHPIKHLIHEKFGDGIMSAIDFTGDCERIPDPAGDRVKLTLNGKFLSYKRW